MPWNPYTELKTNYYNLVTERKGCELCRSMKMVNSSELENDTENIGPWSDWQDSLKAKIVLFGQDWGSVDYYEKVERDKPYGKDKDTNPTNVSLKKLFHILGYDIGLPNQPIKQEDLFFSNSVLCLKEGNMQAKLQQQVYTNCSKFVRGIIRLIKPRIIISLGLETTNAILKAFDSSAFNTMKEVIEKKYLQINVGKYPQNYFYLFPVYHCGKISQNMNRTFDKQIEDWEKIKDFINKEF